MVLVLFMCQAWIDLPSAHRLLIHLLFAVHLIFDRARDDRPYPIVPAMPEGTGAYTREGKRGGEGVEWREGKSGRLEKWCAGWKVV